MPDFIFPLRKRPDLDYTSGGRKFGANRDSGNRLHAGCDLIAPEGTEILAMANGTVTRGPYEFYGGTYALEVQHTGGKVVRYGEISKLVPPGVEKGAAVTQGQVIARVGLLNSGSSMLHLEMYSGTAAGPLTQAGSNKFKRREDLIDPTPHLDAAPLVDTLSTATAAVPPVSTPAAAPSIGRVVNLTDRLRVRRTPLMGADVLFRLSPGEQVVVRRETQGDEYIAGRRDWLEIEHGGQTGFAAGFYIEVGTPAAPAGSEDRWVAALRRAQPAGASAQTAAQDGLAAGVQASHTMAETDVDRVATIAERFATCAGKFGIPAALLAALASRESRCGKVLHDGWGDNHNAFGILQVDKRFHVVQGQPDPASLAHIEQGADILSDFLEAVARRHSDWKDEHLLQGAAVAYNSGVNNVQSIATMDKGTTGDDYGSDVLARAQYLLEHPKLAIFRG